MTKPNDLTGQQFDRLIVLAVAGLDRHGKRLYLCECDCGSSKVIRGQHLTRGYTKSCGCWRIEAPTLAFTTHGKRRSNEYRIWSHMKTRCLNPKSHYYHRYGGRGIAVCPEWVNSFETFYRDMGPRPSAKHSIEREDGNAGYSPSNCVWALPDVQAKNRSTVKLIEHEGVTDTMAGWARRTGIPYLRLRRRLVDGWAVERALAKDCAVRARLYK